MLHVHVLYMCENIIRRCVEESKRLDDIFKKSLGPKKLNAI